MYIIFAGLHTRWLGSGKPDEEKERFWNEVFHLVSCIPQNEMVVFAGDMNGHIGSSNVGYDGTHGGFGHSSRNADGSRILAMMGHMEALDTALGTLMVPGYWSLQMG